MSPATSTALGKKPGLKKIRSVTVASLPQELGITSLAVESVRLVLSWLGLAYATFMRSAALSSEPFEELLQDSTKAKRQRLPYRLRAPRSAKIVLNNSAKKSNSRFLPLVERSADTGRSSELVVLFR